MKYYLGIDPGKQGAFVIIDENSNIVQKFGTPLIGKEYDRQSIKEILTSREFHKVGLENPDVIFGVGKSAVASLSHCVGMIEGMLIGLGISHVLVKPKEWQKECWKHVKVQKKSTGKGNDTKATSTLAALNLWPSENFKVTNRGQSSINQNEGMIDGALVAEYVRRMFK
ncbi:hypothetical protein [Flavobacterium mekongense]|uniref:hypothetical protein n=1 Tax=Flavobacterium mekongense TaxID=3379707 RepID=UPI00399BED2E